VVHFDDHLEAGVCFVLLHPGSFAGCAESLPSRDWKERYETVVLHSAALWGSQFWLQPVLSRLFRGAAWRGGCRQNCLPHNDPCLRDIAQHERVPAH
jgi:hypothetical protein